MTPDLMGLAVEGGVLMQHPVQISKKNNSNHSTTELVYTAYGPIKDFFLAIEITYQFSI